MADKIKGMIPKTITQMLLRLSKKTTKSNEGLNLIYAMKASTVKEIIGPLEGFPRQTHTYLEPVIYRLPYQMNYHFLSCLYAIKMQLDKKKRDK